MKIGEIRTYKGPSIYHDKPALVAELRDFSGITLEQLRHASHLLREVFPDSHLHEAATPAGLVQGVALELNARVKLSSQRQMEQQQTSTLLRGESVILPYLSRKTAVRVLETALELVHLALERKEIDLSGAVAKVRRALEESGLSFNTIALIQAADERGIPWRRLRRPNLVRLGSGAHRRLLQSSWTDRTSLLASELACRKHLAAKVLKEAGVEVPRGKSVETMEAALKAYESLEKPVVIKPGTGKQGISVSLGIEKLEDVKPAFELAKDHCEHVLIEEQISGKDYRVLVVNGKFIAAVERSPAKVTGDGMHTISELVEIENRNPLRGEGHTSPMCRLRLGQEEFMHLERQKLTPGHRPEKGEVVFLRSSANGSAGGTSRDVTDEIHPKLRDLCERAARAIGLDICGVDLISPDISGGKGVILEVNPRPGLQPHLFPASGTPRKVAHALMQALFPEGTPFHVPVIALIGRQGQAAFAELLAEELSAAGKKTALPRYGEFSEAQAMLGDPLYEAAVVHLSMHQVVKEGLPYDRSQVTIFMECDSAGENMGESELSAAFRLLRDHTDREGTLILNTDCRKLFDLSQSLREAENGPNVIAIPAGSAAWFDFGIHPLG